MASDQSHGEERQSDLAVMDANEYKQKRRLERILDSLDGVQDTSDEAWNAYVQGEISREAYEIALQRAVTKAIRESYKLLLNHHREVREAGDDPDRYWEGQPKHHLGTVDLLGEQVDMIQGLRDYHNAPTFFERHVSEEVERRNLPNETVTRTVETTMPTEISHRAYLRLKEFLDDVHDMEISFEELDDKLADEKPTTVELPDDMDLAEVDDLTDFDGPVDTRAVSDGGEPTDD